MFMGVNINTFSSTGKKKKCLPPKPPQKSGPTVSEGMVLRADDFNSEDSLDERVERVDYDGRHGDIDPYAIFD